MAHMLKNHDADDVEEMLMGLQLSTSLMSSALIKLRLWLKPGLL